MYDNGWETACMKDWALGISWRAACTGFDTIILHRDCHYLHT